MAINNETITVTRDLSMQIFTLDLKNPDPAYLATRTNKGHTDLFYENYNDLGTNPNRSTIGEHSSGRRDLTTRTLSSVDALPNPIPRMTSRATVLALIKQR